MWVCVGIWLPSQHVTHQGWRNGSDSNNNEMNRGHLNQTTAPSTAGVNFCLEWRSRKRWINNNEAGSVQSSEKTRPSLGQQAKRSDIVAPPSPTQSKGKVSICIPFFFLLFPFCYFFSFPLYFRRSPTGVMVSIASLSMGEMKRDVRSTRFSFIYSGNHPNLKLKLEWLLSFTMASVSSPLGRIPNTIK